MISVNYSHLNGGIIKLFTNLYRYTIYRLFFVFAGKLWFFIDKKDNDKFIDLLRELSENETEGMETEEGIKIKCPAFYRHKLFWIHPAVVIARGIKVYVSKILAVI